MPHKLLLIAFFLSSYVLHAQKTRFGLGCNLNGTFFHKGESVYDEDHAEALGMPGIGISVPVYIHPEERWSLKTGLGVQMKQFRFRQVNLGIKELRGYSYISNRYAAFEVPVVLCLKNPRTKKYKLEYSLGCVLSVNAPTQQTLGYSFSGGGPAEIMVSAPEPEWKKTFSPDIYGGISFVRYEEKARKHQFTLSYQYGLMPVDGSVMDTKVSDQNNTYEYHTVLEPTLSCLVLGYTYFPKWPR